MKQRIKQAIIKGINSLKFSSEKWGTPKGIISTGEWCRTNKSTYLTVFNRKTVFENHPSTFDGKVNSLFQNEYKRDLHEAFVAKIPNGRVWGRNGTVITSDDLLLEDVSREFGKYKGVTGKNHSVFNRFHLGKLMKIKGNVAVISTAGCSNYYHWMIDVLPRVQLLKLANLFNSIDYFIIDYTGLHFQKESLKKSGIGENKVIRSNSQWKFHVVAENLVVPSLPSELSIVNQWQVDYLKEVFLPTEPVKTTLDRKLFIGRKKANNRLLLNEDEIFQYLSKVGYEIFYPEDHSISDVAAIMHQATDVVSVHGAGNTNWVFCEPGTNFTELFLSTQIYPNYWLIANCVRGNYLYITSGDGELNPGKDPVVNKRDDNFKISLSDIEKVLHKN